MDGNIRMFQYPTSNERPGQGKTADGKPEEQQFLTKQGGVSKNNCFAEI